MKIIEIELENGDIWQIPLKMIAKHRADYYAKNGDSYEEDYDFVMNDEYEGIDWLKNNMYLSDFEYNMKIIPWSKEVDWVNSEMGIRDIGDEE